MMEKLLGADLMKKVVILLAGAGTAYLVYRVLRRAGIGSKCPLPSKCKKDVLTESEDIPLLENPKELKRLFELLRQNQDSYAKALTLHQISSCIHLFGCEELTCTEEEINLIASSMEDKGTLVKVKCLNALNSVAKASKNWDYIEKYVPRVVELSFMSSELDLQMAALKLLGTLTSQPRIHRLLRKSIPEFVRLLQTASNDAKCFLQIQVLKILINLHENSEVLHDILNTRVTQHFLQLFDPTLPRDVLHHLLVFVTGLNNKRRDKTYIITPRQYNEESLHEALFGPRSQLPAKLLRLKTFQEETVQSQVTKLLNTLQ